MNLSISIKEILREKTFSTYLFIWFQMNEIWIWNRPKNMQFYHSFHWKWQSEIVFLIVV